MCWFVDAFVSISLILFESKVGEVEEKDFIPWLCAIYVMGRDWDEITLASIFVPEARGKRFTRIIGNYLRPIRIRIAHAVLDSGELTLSADEEMDIQEVYRWLALTRCIVRHMLKCNFPNEFLPYIAPWRSGGGNHCNAGLASLSIGNKPSTWIASVAEDALGNAATRDSSPEQSRSFDIRIQLRA